MLAAVRQQRIFEDIERLGVSAISDLSQKYAVSEMTIRRDLRVLEEENRIRRTHGGAMRVTESAIEPRYMAKQALHATQKVDIARYAAENFVRNNDIIILEGGTTVTAMVQFLRGAENLTVVTNGLYTSCELQPLLPQATVICTGGILREVSATFVGPIAERFFKELHSNKLFLSTTGFTQDAGFTDPNMLETQVKKAMVTCADQVIMLMDSTKFNIKSLTTVLRAEELDLLITDSGAPTWVRAELEAKGVEVHIVGQ
jgi:DeoR/GlpR family transcriptional regulator of sugar metabolism